MEAIKAADAMTTKEDYLPEDRARAYALFLNNAYSLDDIAIAMSLSRAIVLDWAHRGKWVQRKKSVEEELMKSVEMKFENWQIEHRLEVAKDDFRRAQSIGASIEDTLNKKKADAKEKDDCVSSAELLRLAKTLESSSNTSARSVGLDSEGAKTFQQQGPQKTQLVIVGLRPVQPSEKQVIDATCEEVQ